MKMTKQININMVINNIYNLIFFILCIFVSAHIFISFPNMPASELDPSWCFSMNEAVIQKFALGKDIIFTYGPYISIFTNFYDPANYYIIIIGSLYLTLTFAYALFLNFKNSHYISKLVLLFVILMFPVKESAVLFFPILVFNYICTHFKKDEHYIANTIILLMPLGLLPLIKGTFIILCLIVVATIFVFLMIKDRKNHLNYLILVVPAAFCCLLWLLSGQKLYNIFSFFTSMIPIVTGYTEAMNFDACTNIYIYIYIILAATILYQSCKIIKDYYSIFIYMLTLFLAFKEGFVRYDEHVLISYGFIVLISANLFAKKYRNIPSVLIVISSCLIFINLNMYFLHRNGIHNSDNIAEFTQKHILPNSINRSKDIISYLQSIFSLNFDSWNAKRQRNILSIKDKHPLPLLPGTSDIYSYNQSELLVSGNIWNPRPIFQSYSAYTKILLERNRNHLLSNNRPDNIFFRLQTIDNRYPSLDDGLSWPVIANNYKLISVDNDLAILRRNDKIIYETNMKNIGKMTCKLKTMVDIPQSKLPLFVNIHIEPTLLGRLANIIFNAPVVEINIICKNGGKYKRRIIPKIADSGFFLSPFVQNTSEFAQLISGNHTLLSDNQVMSLSIKANRAFYKNRYILELSEFRYNGE